MDQVFDEKRHHDLLVLLARSRFTEAYLSLCSRYPTYGDMDTRRALDLKATARLFEESEEKVLLLKKWSMLKFGVEEIGSWTWTGSLVVKKNDVLEPMLSASSDDGTLCIGSTLLHLAHEAAPLEAPPCQFPLEGPTRPRFDGDMHTMERMVPDLLGMFNAVKQTLRQGWRS